MDSEEIATNMHCMLYELVLFFVCVFISLKM